MFFGIALVIIGGVFLLQNIGIISSNAGSIIWPLLLIALGLAALTKKHKGNCWSCGRDWSGRKSDDSNR